MTIDARFEINRGSFKLDIDLSIPSNGVTSLFGPSGSGKTTLLRAIAGLEHHRKGFLKVGNTLWQGNGYFLPAHKRSIGYVFQEASLFPHLNVQKNLEYGFKRIPEGCKKVSLADAVDLLGIHHLLERKPDTLSGGERQRVAIARALAASPELLLMDEPLAALDTESRLEILPYLESLSEEMKIPMIYVSHAVEETLRLADYFILLEAGQVIESGSAAEVTTIPDPPFAGQETAFLGGSSKRGTETSLLISKII